MAASFLRNAYPANLLPTNCFIFCALKHRRGEVSGTWEAMGALFGRHILCSTSPCKSRLCCTGFPQLGLTRVTPQYGRKQVLQIAVKRTVGRGWPQAPCPTFSTSHTGGAIDSGKRQRHKQDSENHKCQHKRSPDKLKIRCR
jgi:hypothetical protein